MVLVIVKFSSPAAAGGRQAADRAGASHQQPKGSLASHESRPHQAVTRDSES